MKYILLVSLFFLNIFANSINNDIKKDNIYFSSDLNWIPYSYYDNKIPKGYILDYIKLIAKKGNFTPIFLPDEFSNNIQKIKLKKLDVLSGVIYKKSREDFLLFTDIFLKQKLAIVTNSNSFELKDIKSLDNKTIGMIKNWAITNLMEKNYPKIKIRYYNSLDEIFKDIKNQKIDATVQYNLTAKYYINTKYINTLKTSILPKIKGYDENIYLGVRKDRPDLVDRLNKAMKSITPDELEYLNDKWESNKDQIYLTHKEKEFIKNHTIRVSFTTNWAPISFIDNGKAYGLGFDFWYNIVKKTNLKVEYKTEDKFYKSLDEIKNKTQDVIVTTSKTKDREKYAIFSKVYFKIPIGIVTTKDQNYIPNVESLRGKKIAVGRNYTAYKLLHENYPYLNFVFVDNVTQGLELVSSNKAFAAVDNIPVLAYNIKKNSLHNLKISGDTNLDYNLQVMIRDDYVILKNIIDKALDSQKLEEKEKIYDKWLDLELIKSFDYKFLIKILIPIIIIFFIIIYKNRQLTNYQKALNITKSELELSLESFKSLLDFTVDGIFILKDKKIIFVNNQAISMFQYTKEELLESSIEKLFVLDKDIDLIIEESRKSSIELNAINSENKSFPIMLKSKNILFENNDTIILSTIDMTEIRQRERLLLQQSKIASLSEMLCNIAHQWRQPLSFISTAVTGLKIQKEYNQLEEKVFFKTIDEIEGKTQYLSKIINDFQNYLNGEKTIIKFDLFNCINQVLNILNDNFLENHIKIINNANNNIKIVANENELNQSLIYVLNNAKDALIEKDIKNKNIEINTYIKNSNFAVIEIIDNGGGIDSKIIDKVFEPYFTTKHKAQGTGLGLYMTHKIITQNLKGNIDIENYKSTFTKVTIEIPLK
ncbi:PAS/PAC sensor signal transduction histidine kinase [Arcobacter nitrofigilis DSM 7299]|uniref:histidine kinase n=1 Tax=Arcobacter nitrofigilis (strain ATCC 33309 / DSM 7299 / CCUG 15893 / LMG 7604 / NCTC 12251 / CI) TaxID=572480 RepID=D5UZR9_ARCNC|nr:transporter substrate-binding domain-containing protein [Arcobacter nitrofigilis]ADG93288.1 PAS/PAC sensor signal transduction histidine kinase [Arcobacter nitrofigilis DSM 7299]